MTSETAELYISQDYDEEESRRIGEEIFQEEVDAEEVRQIQLEEEFSRQEMAESLT